MSAKYGMGDHVLAFLGAVFTAVRMGRVLDV